MKTSNRAPLVLQRSTTEATTRFDEAYTRLLPVRLGEASAEMLKKMWSVTSYSPSTTESRATNTRLDKQIQEQLKSLETLLRGPASPQEKLVKLLQETTGLGKSTQHGSLNGQVVTYTALGLTAANLADAATQVHSPEMAAIGALAGAGGFYSAEVLSAVVHFLLDNYGSKDTPIWGGAVKSFQWHHTDQLAEARSSFADSAWRASLGVLAPLAAGVALHLGVPTEAFVAVMSFGAIMATENHKMAHRKPDEVPLLYKMAQRVGLSVPRDGDGSEKPDAPGRGGHGSHHFGSHGHYFGIVNGQSNRVLDRGFFRKLEAAIYHFTGIEPNDWKLDPHLKIESLGEAGRDPAAFEALAAKEQLIRDTKGMIGPKEIARLRGVFPMLEQIGGAWVFTDHQSRNDGTNGPVPLLGEGGRLGREASLRLRELIPDKSQFQQPKVEASQATIDWS